MLREKEIKGIHGWAMLFMLLAVLIYSVYMVVNSIRNLEVFWIVAWLLVFVAAFVCLFGFVI